MRALPLALLIAAFGCDGRYILGALNDQSNNTIETPPSPSVDAGADSAVGADSSPATPDVFVPPSGRTRWLASTTFTSSTSTQTALSFIDLQHPDANPILIENQSAIPVGFSPDGHWYLYVSGRGPNAADYYIVNMTGPQPSARQFVVSTNLPFVCKWAPDSSKLACFKTAEIVSFDTTGSVLGPERSIGSVPIRSATATDISERELFFLDDHTLVYSHGPNDFARVEWNGQTLSAPTLLGVGGGIVVKQSPDGGRAIMRHVDPNDPPENSLVDFRTGHAEPINPALNLTIATSFEAAIGTNQPPPGDTGFGSYSFYRIHGTTISWVAEQPAEQLKSFNMSPLLLGHTVFRVKGDRVVAIAIDDDQIVEHEIPGDYKGLSALRLDPSGKWLYIGTADIDGENRPIESTIKHWLSALTNPSEPAQAALLGQGFSIATGAGVFWSPDSQRVVLHGYDSYPRTGLPIAFRMFDLGAPQFKEHIVDVTLAWAETSWSSDSTYLSVIGGSPNLGTRPMFVVDAFAPEVPRKLAECGPNAASGPICPNRAAFQP